MHASSKMQMELEVFIAFSVATSQDPICPLERSIAFAVYACRVTLRNAHIILAAAPDSSSHGSRVC